METQCLRQSRISLSGKLYLGLEVKFLIVVNVERSAGLWITGENDFTKKVKGRLK